jgi:hypothetical protein
VVNFKADMQALDQERPSRQTLGKERTPPFRAKNCILTYAIDNQ